MNDDKFKGPNELFAQLAGKVNELIENKEQVAQDIKQNVQGLMASGLSKLDVVTREEFEVQKQILQRTRKKLDALDAMFEKLDK